MTQLTYYAGTDNAPVVNVRDLNGDAVSLAGATRFVAVFHGRDTSNNFTVDTDITSGAITGDASGDITFNLGSVSVTEDLYQIRLTVYDAVHTSGQRFADECCGPYLCMKICGTSSSVTYTTWDNGDYDFDSETVITISNSNLTLQIVEVEDEGGGE